MYFFYNKKTRGQQRKLNALLKNIDQLVPFCNTDDDYEHFHVPSDMFIESPKTYGKVKTAFCEKWLEKTQQFISQKPDNLPFCKVVALIDVPNYWSSQIIIFYSKSYYDSFWDRDNDLQTWKPLGDKMVSFAKSRNLSTALSEKGYMEIMNVDGNCLKSMLWFYGEIL